MSGLSVIVPTGRVNTVSVKTNRTALRPDRFAVGNPLYVCAVRQTSIPLSFEHA
jgi:hypothetical protein